MADLANLKIGIDSREVNAATKDLQALGAAAEGAQKDVRNVGTAAQGTGSAMRNMTSIIQQGEQAQIAAANANRAVGQTGQLARHHMMNLGFQFQDLGVQIASGQNPLVAFVQQGAQIGGIMQQAEIGIGGVVRSLGSMVASITMAIVTNPILMGIAAAAASVALAFNFMADDISAATGVAVTSGDVMMGAFDVVRNFLATQVTAAFAYFGTTAGEVWNTVVGYTRKAVNIIIGIVSLIPRAFVEAFKTVPIAINQLMSGNFSGALATIGGSMGKIAGDTFGRDYIGEVGIAISAAAVNRANQRKAEEAGKKIGHKVSTGAAKGLEDGRKEFVTALDNLIAENKKIGLSPEAIRQMEVENLAVRAAAKGYNDLAANIRKVGMARELNLYAVSIADKLKEEAKARDEANKSHSQTIKELQNEQKLIGLTGTARELAILQQEKEAYVLKNELAMGATAAAAAAEEFYQAKLKNFNLKGAYDEDIKATETLVNNLETAAGMIGGKLGRSLQGILKLEVQLADGSTKKISEAIASSFKNIAKTLSAATAGAQVGTSVDAVFKSIGIKSSNMGAQAGGAIGGAAFGPVGAIAGSILGGVLGGMLKKTKTGSATISQIAGQGMQTALSGNSAALKDVSNNMVSGLLKGLGSIAEQLGGTLGGSVKVSLGMRKNDYVVDPTGMGRTTGSGVKNFGTDQAAAVAYVTQLAIQQGIMTGISAGAQTLIRAGTDLNDQVQKALKFDQVFKDLMSETDPLQSSLNELSTELEKLKAIFNEAGASAADYAKLEELYAIKQAKAIFEANRPRRELEIQLMEAQGDAVGALAAQRALELESMDASLRGLKQQIYAAEDASKAAEALTNAQNLAAEAQAQAAQEAADLAEATLRLARERRGLEIDLMEAQGNATGALSARRMLELEAMDASLRALQKQVWATQDKAAADEKAAEAAKQYKDALASVTQTIVDEVNRLRGINTSSSSVLLKAQFATLTAQARNGNLDALGKLPELSRSIEEATLGSATSALEVARIRAWLSASLSETLGAQAATNAEVATTGAGLVFDGNQTSMANSSAQTADGIANMRNEMYNALYQVAKNTGKSYELMDRWDGNGLPDIREDASDYY